MLATLIYKIQLDKRVKIMFYLYSIINDEGDTTLIWAETTIEASEIYYDLFEGTIKTIEPLPYDTPIYYIKKQGDEIGTWNMDTIGVMEDDINISTTIGILGENMSNE